MRSPASCIKPVLCVHKAIVQHAFIYRSPGLITLNSSQVLGGSPQSVLSCATARYHNYPPHEDDHAEAFGQPIFYLQPHATRRDDYIASQDATASPSNPPPSLGTPEEMNYHFSTETLPPFDGYAVSSNKGAARTYAQAPRCDPIVSDPLYGPYDGTGRCSMPISINDSVSPVSTQDFPQGLLFCPPVETADPLASLGWGFSFDDALGNPSSPSSRSMSRSSFSSSFVADTWSPYPEDYPTPSSDSAVTTPAPSEACVGLPSDFSQTLFGDDFSLGLDTKTEGEHALCYVPGSAPLSPSGSFALDLSRIPQSIPTVSTGRIAEARRHSEPANIAALHFAPFFASSHEVPPPIAPVPADLLSMTLPITDNLASTSGTGSHSAVPSSIAPHQTELPRPLELKQPKPVRGFKPPILLSGYQYDPKDFVRRRSEPVLPLPDLDVASHLPLDVPQESDEDDDSMDFEDSVYEDAPEDDGCDEESIDPALFEGMDMDSFLGMNQDGSLFDPNWSWLQQGPTSTLPPEEVFSQGFDWSAPGASFPSMTPGTISLDAFFGSH